MKKLAPFAAAAVWALPALALAQTSVFTLAGTITNIINGVLVPLVFAIAFLMFIWGIFQYFIMGGDNKEKRGEAVKLMLYGIVGFFVMVSVWGLVNILVGTFNLNSNVPNLPPAPGPR
jgi:hypothetical protein